MHGCILQQYCNRNIALFQIACRMSRVCLTRCNICTVHNICKAAACQACQYAGQGIYIVKRHVFFSMTSMQITHSNTGEHLLYKTRTFWAARPTHRHPAVYLVAALVGKIVANFRWEGSVPKTLYRQQHRQQRCLQLCSHDFLLKPLATREVHKLAGRVIMRSISNHVARQSTHGALPILQQQRSSCQGQIVQAFMLERRCLCAASFQTSSCQPSQQQHHIGSCLLLFRQSSAHRHVCLQLFATTPGGASADIDRSLSTSPQASSQEQQVASSQPQQSTQQRATRYSPLHHNITEFCQRIVPTEEEKKYKQQIVDLVRTHTRKAMLDAGRPCEVQIFGSFATGLSTWSSDVDLVVTGVMEPDRVSGMYDINDRGRVVGRLRRIGEALRKCKKLDNPRISVIPRARIPIIKLKVRNVNVDIGISDDTGPRAARYMAQQVRAYPPMKPLVLVLKAYLRSVGLNEVMYGGLSSYSLCNMVVAHLQEELKAGRDIYDLGESLYSFLLRYGEDFDYGHDAVSIESGGIVPKHVLGMSSDVGRGYDLADKYWERLAVDCPITGRDVSNGTYRVDAVRMAFQRAARRLEALARGRKIDDLSVNYLQALFDVNKVLKRGLQESEYEDDFIRVMGKGTSPEVIQIGHVDDWEDDDEEEIIGTDADTDMWGGSDSDSNSSVAEGSTRSSKGKDDRKSKGRGKGSR